MSAFRQAVTIGALALAINVSAASAQIAEAPLVLAPEEIDWQPAPPWLPPGAQVAVLYGHPGEAALFALRVKVPAGYHVPPHTHPIDKVVVLISGKLRVGMEETADRSRAQVLRPGGFWVVPAGVPDYVFAEEDTILQLTTVGPWGIEYIDPEDDPAGHPQ